MFAANAIAGQIFGQGGGDEARRSEFLSTLRKRSEAQGPEASSTTSPSSTTPTRRRRSARRFPYGKVAGRRKGNAVLDAGSFKPVGPPGLARAAARDPRWASNFLLVGAHALRHRPPAVRRPARRSATCTPASRSRPTSAAPASQARGATAPGFPGNILIGRGQDFAWSLTSAGSDLIDDVRRDAVRRLEDQVRLQGQVREDGDARRGHDQGRGPRQVPHHRPRPGDRLREGRRQDRGDLAQARELRPGHPLAAPVPRPHDRQGRPAEQLRSTRSRARRSRSTSATRTTATSRCTRPASSRSATRGWTRGCPPRAPASTSGRASWRRSTRAGRPAVRPAGELEQPPGARWGAADDNWAYGSLQRVRMLNDGLANAQTHDLASVTSAMNAAATQDLRSVAADAGARRAVARRAPPPSPRASRCSTARCMARRPARAG